MQAIEVHTVPATNYKPTRIVARAAGGARLMMSTSAAEDLATDDHAESVARVVAQALADKMQWGPLGHGGGTRRGYVFCFADKGAA